MDLVYNFLENNIILERSTNIVVGVSAGPDSMFLLKLLIDLRKKYGFKIIVAHINHNIREESVEEEEFLKKYSLENNVEFEVFKIENYDTKENFHTYAREKRYNFYSKLIDKYHASYLMTAHHGDDLIETVLMRLTRGSTLNGYHGISLITDQDNYKIIRPLLFLTKNEIKEYNDLHNIPYRVDKSNESDKYTRNRYRKYILPFLKEENKNVHLKFLKFSKNLEDASNYIDNIVCEIYKKVYFENKIIINLFIEVDDFIKKQVLEKVLKDIYSNLSNITDKHVDELIKLIKKNRTGSSLSLPNNVIARIDYDYLTFSKALENLEYIFELKDDLILPNGMKFIKYVGKSNGNDILHLESSSVKLPLYVRNKRDGDFIELKGSGKKKVKDIFIDCKINREVRNGYPVVVDSENKIIWIPKLKKSKYDSKNHEKCDIIYKCL